MDHIEAPGVCTKCADNTYTLTNASTSKRQCLCVKGYMGPPGGPCAGQLKDTITHDPHGHNQYFLRLLLSCLLCEK